MGHAASLRCQLQLLKGYVIPRDVCIDCWIFLYGVEMPLSLMGLGICFEVLLAPWGIAQGVSDVTAV